jgi:hypothetical protein
VETFSKRKKESLLEDFSKFINLNQTTILKICGNGQ